MAILRLLVVGVLAALASTAPAPAADSTPCGESGYSYAGLLGAEPSAGVAATVRAVRAPRVVKGHVAAWVGVGGYGMGANGTDAWLQAGLIARPDGTSAVYYEVTRPGYRPVLQVLRSARPGAPYRIAVREVAGRPGWWRAWVDGRAVTPPLRLPGSHGLWEPTATAESWDGGERVCNRFGFAFGSVSVADRPGGGWRPLGKAVVLRSPGQRLARTPAGFTAAA